MGLGRLSPSFRDTSKAWTRHPEPIISRFRVRSISCAERAPRNDDALSSRNEGEQVGVDGGGFRGRHAVRKALVGLQRPVLQKLCRQWSGVGIGNDLIV